MAACLFGLAACEDCVAPGEGEGEGQPPSGEGEGEGTTPQEGEGEGGGSCGESTPGYGDECSASGTGPLCGVFVCNPITDTLACADPGPNDCGVCGDLDDAAGKPGEACGTFGCGIAQCNGPGTATVCQNAEKPRNACGGCDVLFPLDAVPEESCSECGSGTYKCTYDDNDIVCFRGRAPDTACGDGCGQCILAHAVMEDRHTGGFLSPGSVAIFEDVGGGDGIQMYFDPLVQGAGASGLPSGTLYLSSGENPYESASYALSPSFAAALQPLPPDPVRIFTVPSFVDLDFYNHLVLVDESGLFLDPIFSVGTLVTGPVTP